MVCDIVVPDWGAVSVPDVKPGPRLPQLDGVLVAVSDRARAERQPAPRIATEMSPPPRHDAELLAEPNVWSRAVGTGPYRRGLDLPTGITPADVVRATADSPGMPPVVLACRMNRAGIRQHLRHRPTTWKFCCPWLWQKTHEVG